MTNSYSNAVSGATATSAPSFSSHASTNHAQNGANSSTASAQRAPIASWVESGFVVIPTEFFRVAAGQLSARAQKLYFLHCSHARTRGENAGLSFCYRETLARELNCSLDTIDRGNLELEKHGLITDAGRRFQHGGAVVYRLNPPSKWKLKSSDKPVKMSVRASGKSAAREPQLCGEGAAKVRSITRAKTRLKAKEQQTALSSDESLQPDLALVEAVESVVVEKNLDSVGTAKDSAEEIKACSALEAQGFVAGMAQRLMLEYGAQACLYQIERLTRQNEVRSRTGWLISALKRNDRDEIAATKQAATPPPSPAQKAEKMARMAARREREDAVAAQVWAALDGKRQAYISRCVELDGLSLTEVIKRDEHYAFSSQRD